MFDVTCPECKQKRLIATWKKKDGNGPPYVKLCKSCVQAGKVLSDETKKKLSVPKPEGFGHMVAEQHKKNPHLKDSLVPGAGGGWNRGQTMKPLSEETKAKISESMKGKNTNDGL